MAVDAEQLAAYVEAETGDTYPQQCLTEAVALVDGLLGVGAAARTPEAVKDRAVLETAATLYYSRTTRLGVIGLGEIDAQPIRAAKDPLSKARVIVGPYLIGLA